MTIRATTPEDEETALRWLAGHEGEVTEASRFPKIGCAAEDANGPLAFVWAYLVPELGIAQLESFITRPGIKLAVQAKAGQAVVSGISAAVKSHGFSIVVAYSLPACARYLVRMGWDVADRRPKIAMIRKL